MRVFVLSDRDDEWQWQTVGVVTSHASAIEWVEHWPEVRKYEQFDAVLFIARNEGQNSKIEG